MAYFEHFHHEQRPNWYSITEKYQVLQCTSLFFCNSSAILNSKMRFFNIKIFKVLSGKHALWNSNISMRTNCIQVYTYHRRAVWKICFLCIERVHPLKKNPYSFTPIPLDKNKFSLFSCETYKYIPLSVYIKTNMHPFRCILKQNRVVLWF